MSDMKNTFESNRDNAQIALDAVMKVDSTLLGAQANNLPTLRCWLREIIEQSDQKLSGENT